MSFPKMRKTCLWIVSKEYKEFGDQIDATEDEMITKLKEREDNK